ncbi:threonine-phosphate decarboxylase [Azoarcus sp. L1K30]|uniref:threonine-phosphate decarboxylase CobD n=1 Tax=Azoarcus sp. L1K30 TaxID=2820277 RepID=UPI001B811BF1|nr:threonine-phosphate decarboxylase CobD [Azoarcus sp. L1K30]MBR0568038.1 threonine-phosphate decarboxylase [Azoarcus sp. L1K30]
MLEHGGRLRIAAAKYGIALEDWLDLSTAINPRPWPVPALAPDAWHRLPEDNDGLEDAAMAYYCTGQVLAVAGSQAAIQSLPELIPGRVVTIPAPTYAEHPHAWRGRILRRVAADPDCIDACIDSTDVLVLVNPNNPSGTHYPRTRLLDWHRRLAARGGWLVIDEAFIDPDPSESLAACAGNPGLVILRSAGKFFGLAGARVGFVLAPEALRAALGARLGPWTVSGPARAVVQAALRDRAWHDSTRRRLQADGERLASLLHHAGFDDVRGPALFKWFEHPAARAIAHQLAGHGILVRHFDAPASLRFGLPPDEHGWQRLADTLQSTAIKELRR